jgi:hypothetical protein
MYTTQKYKKLSDLYNLFDCKYQNTTTTLNYWMVDSGDGTLARVRAKQAI